MYFKPMLYQSANSQESLVWDNTSSVASISADRPNVKMTAAISFHH
jgi:hypothetical protein